MRGTPSIGTYTFLRYNMKFRGKHYTTVHKIVRVVSRFPRYTVHIMFYRGKSLSCGTVYSLLKKAYCIVSLPVITQTFLLEVKMYTKNLKKMK